MFQNIVECVPKYCRRLRTICRLKKTGKTLAWVITPAISKSSLKSRTTLRQTIAFCCNFHRYLLSHMLSPKRLLRSIQVCLYFYVLFRNVLPSQRGLTPCLLSRWLVKKRRLKFCCTCKFETYKQKTLFKIKPIAYDLKRTEKFATLQKL